MKIGSIVLFLLFLTAAPAVAETPPAQMSDEALASYISGRLSLLLEGDGYQVSQSCDASGCAVVIQ